MLTCWLEELLHILNDLSWQKKEALAAAEEQPLLRTPVQWPCGRAPRKLTTHFTALARWKEGCFVISWFLPWALQQRCQAAGLENMRPSSNQANATVRGMLALVDAGPLVQDWTCSEMKPPKYVEEAPGNMRRRAQTLG